MTNLSTHRLGCGVCLFYVFSGRGQAQITSFWSSWLLTPDWNTETSSVSVFNHPPSLCKLPDWFCLQVDELAKFKCAQPLTVVAVKCTKHVRIQQYLHWNTETLPAQLRILNTVECYIFYLIKKKLITAIEEGETRSICTLFQYIRNAVSQLGLR